MALFLHLLINANHQKSRFLWNRKVIEIEAGQLVTGRKQLSEQTGISSQSVRTALVNLKSTNTITITSTTKYSVITILNWTSYQELTNKTTIKQPTTNQQLTTNKNDKNEEKDKNIVSKDTSVSVAEVLSLFQTVNPSYKQFYANKTQRACAARLIEQYGIEKLTNLIGRLPEIIHTPYAPSITSPYELEVKMGKLLAFLQQDSRKINKFGVTRV
jgi:DNA replication protein DnaD